MTEFLEKLIPNVLDYKERFLPGLSNTLLMTLYSGIIAFILGLFIGILLVVCKKGGIMQCKPLYKVTDIIINIFRSIPFLILLAALFPFTRAIVGTASGSVKAAIIPLIFGTVPYFSRQVELALSEVDGGLIEAAESMGKSPLEIIFRVYMRESIPGLIRGTTITLISLIGLTVIVDYTIGVSGLGSLAINTGFARNKPDIIYAVVLIIFLLITLVQQLGNLAVKKTTH